MTRADQKIINHGGVSGGKDCLCCGKFFYATPAILLKRKYCSRPCYEIGSNQPHPSKPCKNCGELFSCKPSALVHRLYCSKKCGGVANAAAICAKTDAIPGSKKCSYCCRVLPQSEFFKRADRDRLMSRCKECHTKATEAYRKASPEVRARRYQTARKSLMRSVYGLTIEQYNAIFASQNGVCALCGLPEQKAKKNGMCNLSVDHDHATGKVRALLCHACNTALGGFRDDPALLRKAANYVEEHKS